MGPFQRRSTVKIATLVSAALIAATASAAQAADITIKMYALTDKGLGKTIGTIRAVDTKKGLMLVPHLSGLTAGDHGIHVHQNPSCGAKGADGKMGAGLAAGGHYDPAKTGHHEGPMGKGHLGDLPVLVVDSAGDAKKPMYAPHLKVDELWGRAIVIHAGGDNYSDQPKALGGGGARVACGTIKKDAPKKMKKM
jgi:superoxide dismutase, Cu-Zn family